MPLLRVVRAVQRARPAAQLHMLKSSSGQLLCSFSQGVVDAKREAQLARLASWIDEVSKQTQAPTPLFWCP